MRGRRHRQHAVRIRRAQFEHIARKTGHLQGIDDFDVAARGREARQDPLAVTRIDGACGDHAAARTDGQHVWPIFDAAFREFGLPLVVRSDNGPPFASTAAGGLSHLAVTLIKAGVTPERIDPGKPQQNAYIERYNRTVRQEWLNQYVFRNIREVQETATQWLWTYNNERPNMGLGGITPAQKLNRQMAMQIAA